MNVDKFGHHVHKRLRLTEYIGNYNETLVKSDTGHYDLKSSKLKGLSYPTEDDEAVNKAYLDKTVQELRNEVEKVKLEMKLHLKNLETFTTDHLNKSFYSKSEIDKLIHVKIKKNEQKGDN